MPAYQENHYYRTQVPTAKPCCGCGSGNGANSTQAIANIEAQLDTLAEMLNTTVEIKSLGGEKVATVYTKD